MDIHATVTGDRQVGLRFDAFPDALHDDLLAAIGALGQQLDDMVLAAEPDLTGRLRSETRLRIFDDKTRIKAEVDVSAEQAKAGALEYGAHRATKVGAHHMRLDHAWRRALSEPMDVLVADYTRTPDIAEVDFLRGPLGEMSPQIIERLNAVVASRAKATNA